MKWKRGLFRLWLLSSALWTAAVLAIAVRNETGRAPSTSVHVEFSNTETWDYPVEWGEKRIRAALEERIAALAAEERKWVAELAEDRKAACRDWPKSTPLSPLPADCERLFSATNSELAVPTGWEAQLPQPLWTTTLLLRALGLPAAVFLLGIVTIWAGHGFRPKARRGFFRLWIVLSLLWVAGASHYYQVATCGAMKGQEQFGWYCRSGWQPIDENVGYEIVPVDEALAWTIGPPVGALLLGFLMFWIGGGSRRASN
jgi:hypothetical protein